ncbi:MAG: VOC family protein [Chloroflexi bacterium]|nr:VOC family protein [Chloroflexota bacterium]
MDHLVYGVPDLRAAVELLAGRLGSTPSPGGRHPGRGTRNYLVGLGGDAYLEIIGRDPDGPPTSSRLPFGLERLGEAGLLAWAARTADLDASVAAARERGYDPGPIHSMSREQPGGEMLRWRLTLPGGPFPDPIPFLIDWGRSPHPSSALSHEVRLIDFQAETPDPARIEDALSALGIALPIRRADEPALIAILQTPHGTVTLR